MKRFLVIVVIAIAAVVLIGSYFYGVVQKIAAEKFLLEANKASKELEAAKIELLATKEELQNCRSIPSAVKCEKQCDSSRENYANLRKYGWNESYDLVQAANGDSTTIMFNFVDYCSRDYTGQASLLKDTLLITYHLSDTFPKPDCLCCYRMLYQIKSKGRTWSHVKTKYTPSNI